MKMAQALPAGYFVRYIEPVGHHDLNGKPAFKLAVQEGNSRVIFFYGHIDSGKYFDGAQTLTVKLLHPRTRSSRMMRM
jgi:hypothetical protein